MQNAVQNAVQNQNVSPKPPHCSMADSITQMKAAGQYMGQHAYQRSQLEAKLRQHNSNTMNSINLMNPVNETYSTMTGPIYSESSAGAPPWVSQLFEGLDIRLNQIEAHLINQNTR